MNSTLLLTVAMTLTAFAPALAGCRLRCAFYRADRDPGYHWTEGNVVLQPFFGKFYRPAGSLHIYVQNIGGKPVRIKQVLLNGENVGTLWQKKSVVWWRTLPNPIPARGFAESIIRLREALRRDASLKLVLTDGDALSVSVPALPDNLRLESVAFSPALDALYAYASLRSGSEAVRKVLVDGEDLTKAAEIPVPPFFHGLSPVVAHLDHSVAYGSYHLIEVLCQRERTAALVRAADARFEIGTFGNHYFDDYAANHLNTYQSFGTLNSEQLDRAWKSGLRVTAPYFDARKAYFHDRLDLSTVRKQVREIKEHPALYAYYLEDEPDCFDWDYPHKPTPEEMPRRIGETAMEMVWRDEFFRTEDPRNLTMCLVNNSWKPAHWFIYGEIADLFDTDPYVAPAPARTGDLDYVRRATETARAASAPRPLFVTTWLGWGGRHCRCVTEDEERVMVYYAIGSGARGINYFIHSSSAGDTAVLTGVLAPALQARKEEAEKEANALWEGVGRINRELERVAPLLASGCPLDVTVTVPEGLWVRAIACGKQHLVLVIVNNDYVSTGESFSQNPVKSAPFSVETPPWLKVTKAVEIRADQNQDLDFQSAGGRVSFMLPEVASGRMVVLTADRERFALEPDRERFQERYRIDSPRTTGEPGYIYGVSTPRLWNPTGTQYNGLFWCDKFYAQGVDSEVKQDFTVTWRVPVAEGDAGKPLRLALNFLSVNNPNVAVSVFDSTGTVLDSASIPTQPAQFVLRRTVNFPRAGDYTVECRQKYTRGSSGQVATSIYVSPEGFTAIPSPPRVLTRAPLNVDCAFFRPDQPETPTSAGGSLHLYLTNTSDKPVQPSAIYVDDTDLDTLITRHQIAWYRLRPDAIPARKSSELLIRLQHLAGKDAATVKVLVAEGTGVQRTVPFVTPPLTIASAAFSPAMDRLYLHVGKGLSLGPVSDRSPQLRPQVSSRTGDLRSARPRGSPGLLRPSPSTDLRLACAFFDGADVTPCTTFLSRQFLRNVVPLVINLPSPPIQGSFHIVRVSTTEGDSTACEVRAAPSYLEIGTFGNHYFEDYAANHFNTYQSFGALGKDHLDKAWKAGLRVTAPYFQARKAYFYENLDLTEVQREIAEVRGHPALFAYYLEDEPDCFDYEYKGWLGCTAMEMRKRGDFYNREDPKTLTMCLVNNTYSPGNYFTYGQLADLFDTDPYVAPALGKQSDLAFVRRATQLAHSASAPHPLFITLWMGWGGSHCRCVTEAEERTMVYYAIGEGARGINYFIHSSGAGDTALFTGLYAPSLQARKEEATKEAQALWEGVGRISRELERVSPFLARAHPLQCITSAPEKVWGKALVCENALILVLVNENYVATGEKFQQTRMADIQVQAKAPPWLKLTSAKLVKADGLSSLPFRHLAGEAMIQLPELSDAVMLLLQAER